MRLFNRREPEMVETATALPGRSDEMRVPTLHDVLGTPLKGPFPGGIRTAVFGMGCFWGAERMFWQAEGVYTTAVGYAGGFTPNPTYEEVCSGMTGHAEVVLVGYDISRTSYEDMLRIFWEGHDPTQGMRQGNDLGTQYRSLLMWRRRGPAGRRRSLPGCLPGATDRGRARHDHDRVPTRRRRAPLLLRGGLPPAVPGQEPGRLLRTGGTGVSCPVGVGVSAEPVSEGAEPVES